MGLYEQIRDTAKKQGYSINRLEQELGFARSSINKFNKNKPSIDKLQQIADFLGVTVDCLSSGKEEPKEANPELTAKDKRDITKDLNRIMEEMERGNDAPLSFNGTDMSSTSMELLRNAIEYALTETKKENKIKFNPNKNKK